MNLRSFSIGLFILVIALSSCSHTHIPSEVELEYTPTNVLNYFGTPDSASDRSALAFSDQGAWFAYGFPEDIDCYGGFSGPFLMTQDNGLWSSKGLSQLQLINDDSNKSIDWREFSHSSTSHLSHMVQVFESHDLRITQTLFFASHNSTLITTEITNLTNNNVVYKPSWSGTLFPNDIVSTEYKNGVELKSMRSLAKGSVQAFGTHLESIQTTDTSYTISLEEIKIETGQSKKLTLSHSFIFPEYSASQEDTFMLNVVALPDFIFNQRIQEKKEQMTGLYQKLDTIWSDTIYKNLMAKTVLTLQNNWRVSAGELKHSGLFPSYHYEWFHGFWAWDSWKHAVALAQYDTELAKDQILAMYDFQQLNGFIPDCVYRDTTIENHNFRNTKPPLSAWSTWNVFEQSEDLDFLESIYPKIVKQHEWWYANRDIDQDGLCEYGSTDGSLIAAKWESGMDNAVRFDQSQILRKSETSFSLNQESVDLNAYLYAEKVFMVKMASILNDSLRLVKLTKEAEVLKVQIQNQFFDSESGWFYDTTLDGSTFISDMGCEGWIPLWAKVASEKQAEAIKNGMMNPALFFTPVPFQTLSASHPKFEPNGGYWRGPNWLDQAYFGIIGLRNYGYEKEATLATNRVFHNAEGVLSKGVSIRENYQPITGAGLESRNFTWSAAHYLLLLLE